MTFVELVMALVRAGATASIVDGELVLGADPARDQTLAAAIDEHRAALTALVRGDPALLGGTAAVPTTPGQARLIRLSRFSSGGEANATAVFRIRSDGPDDLDADRLVEVLRGLGRRHEALTLAFELTGRGVVQRTVPGLEPEVVVTAGREADLDGWLARFARRPFDLEHGPPWRVGLVRLGAGDHVLALSAHHAVIDETSLRVVVADAAAAYRASAAPAEAVEALGRAPGYLAAAADQLAWLRSDAARVAVQRSLGRLAAVRAGATSRSCDRLDDGDDALAQLALDLDPSRAAALGDLGRSHGGRTITAVVAAAGLAMAGRADGAPFVIGLTVANRRDVDATTVGMFITTAPLVMSIDPDDTFGAVLDATQIQLLDAVADARVPSERFLPRAARSLGVRTSDVVALQVNWIPGLAPFDLPGARVERLAAPPFAGGADVTLEGRRTPDGGVRLHLTYDRTRWSGAEAADLLGRIDRILGRAVDEVALPARVLLRPDAGQDAVIEVLERGPDLRVDPSGGATIVEVIGDALGRRPEHPVVVTDDAIITAAELLAEIEEVRLELLEGGAGRGRVVDHRRPRGIDSIAWLLGTLWVGAAAVVQEPATPDDQARERVRRAASAVRAASSARAIAGSDAADAPAGAAADGAAEVDPEGDRDGDGNARPVPDDVAYVLFTSGSTGEPKGVQIEHRNLQSFVAAMQQVHPLGPDDRVLVHTPLSFDVGLAEVLWPLAAGATLVLTPPDADRSARLGAIERHEVTVVIGVPTVLGAIVGGPTTATGAGPQVVFAIGEVLEPALVERIHDRWPGTTVVNLYGPTETTIASTHHVVRASDPPGPVPIGLPLPGEWAGVLDGDGERVALDVPGDLWIAGAGVARGYLDDAQTAAAFVADDRVPGGRRYRTGDRATWRLDGTLEFLGRVDGQLKVGGMRTEPGAVEVLLAGHPSVQAAAVVPWTAPTGRVRLAALVVPDDGAVVDPVALRRWVARDLPAALVPTHVELVTALPTTSSGKLDRAALAVRPPPTSATPTVTPTGQDRRAASATEVRLARAVAEVLGIDEIGVDDDLVALGLDSLAAVEVAEIAEAEGWALLPQQLVELGDVASVAAAIDGVP